MFARRSAKTMTFAMLLNTYSSYHFQFYIHFYDTFCFFTFLKIQLAAKFSRKRKKGLTILLLMLFKN
jgi:hypothetical protein